ncbi:MAG: AI-2E family transporter [Acidimicrobiia bacterium]
MTDSSAVSESPELMVPPDRRLPSWFVTLGAASWRLIAIGVVIYFGFEVLRSVKVVIIAVVISLFLASVLWAPVKWLIDSANWPPTVASLTAMLVALAALTGLMSFVVPSIASNFDNLSNDVVRAWESLTEWLITGPLGLTQSQVDGFVESVLDQLQSIRGESVLGGAAAVAEFFSGVFLAVIVTFFILKDGRPMAKKFIARLPEHRANDFAVAIKVGWRTLTDYMRGIALVGLFDATVIAIGLWIVGVPLILPLAILVFFGAFFPLVGAFASGLFAVAVAFVNGGWVDGFIVLVIVVVVQQVEGDVVLPLVFGQRMQLHPLVILLGIAAGGFAFGLLGAFLAIPLMAVVVSVHEALNDNHDTSYWGLIRG